MKVILLEEVRGKGGEGDVVEVAQGYAENFLFPQHKALKATEGNLKQLEERRHNIEAREADRIKNAEALQQKLDEQVVEMDVKIGEEGQLFGSVTNAMIAEAVKKQLGVDLDRKRIELGRPIKVAGLHKVTVNLYRTIFATLLVQVGNPEELPEGSTKVPADEELAVSKTPASDKPETNEVANKESSKQEVVPDDSRSQEKAEGEDEGQAETQEGTDEATTKDSQE